MLVMLQNLSNLYPMIAIEIIVMRFMLMLPAKEKPNAKVHTNERMKINPKRLEKLMGLLNQCMLYQKGSVTNSSRFRFFEAQLFFPGQRLMEQA